MFLYDLKVKNGTNSYGLTGFDEQENISIDEQNAIYTLQSHSLQISRELAMRRNAALKKMHPRGSSLDPMELVIEIPELRSTDHCYDKRSVDRREALRKISCSNKRNMGRCFIIGKNGQQPPSASIKRIFDDLLSGQDNQDLMRNCFDLMEDKNKTQSAISSSFSEANAIKQKIVKAQQKKVVGSNLGKALLELNKRKTDISEVNSVKDAEAMAPQLEREIEESESKVADLEAEASRAASELANFKKKLAPRDAVCFSSSSFAVIGDIENFLKELRNGQKSDSARAGIINAIKNFVGSALSKDEIADTVDEAIGKFLETDFAALNEEDVANIAGDFATMVMKGKIETLDGSTIDYTLTRPCLAERFVDKKSQMEKADKAARDAKLGNNGAIKAKRSELSQLRAILEPKRKVEDAIALINEKTADVDGWPEQSEIGNLETQFEAMATNIKRLTYLEPWRLWQWVKSLRTTPHQVMRLTFLKMMQDILETPLSLDYE
jgi:hypothetical protein